MAAVPLTSIEPLRPLFAYRPLGLFSDIDGTLAPIVPRPEDARVTPTGRRLLKRLNDSGIRIALITGRTLELARRMTGLDSLAYAANHGMTISIDGVDETPEEVANYVALAGNLARELAGREIDGVYVEHTGPNLAVHYRRAADGETARARILEAIESADAARRFRLHEGRKVFELRPPLPVNKGTALERLVRRFALRGVLCLGDDQTDIDMFDTVARLREGGVQGISVAVLSEESPVGLTDAADFTVNGVPGVEWLLAELLRALGE